MAEFRITMGIMLPILLQLGLGWLLRRVGWLKGDVAAELNKLIFRLFLPLLLFNNVRSLTISNAPDWSFELFLFAGVMVVFLLASWLVPRFEPSVRKRGAMVQGIFRTNFAILGIPLMEAMFGASGIAMVSLALPVVIPLNNILAVVALAAPSGKKAEPGKLIRGVVTNPLIIACALGAVCFLVRWQPPEAIDRVCNQLGDVTTPLSLLVLGASLQWQGVRDNRRQLVWTVLLKQAIIPAVMVTIAIALGFHHEALGVIIVLFGAPCAVSSYPMAAAMGSDGDLAASQVVLTTVFSMGTLFALIYVGKLLGVL